MINRRDFLQNGLATVSLGLGVPGVFARGVAAAANEGSTGGKTLIVVQLAGGVDGLNTVVPFKDPAYRSSRPSLGIAENTLLPVNDRVAFHPSLSKLKGLFDAGKLAVVEGVGYPNPSFSHFRAMDIWQGGDPEMKLHDGWLGRYFDGQTDLQGHPLAGVSIGASAPKSLSARKAALPAIESVESFGLQPSATDKEPQARATSLLKLYESYQPANTPFAALLDTTLESAYSASTKLKQVDSAYKPAVQYPQSALSSGLRLLAELIDSGSAEDRLRVGHVSLTGFDTHTQQSNRLAPLLTELSEGLNAFWSDIVGHGHADDVLVMTWSEFGRRVKENGQNGTDHGSAAPLFVLGGAVKGGFYGAPPSLANLDDGNLRFTTDFRSVYATVLERWLKAPSDDVLGGRFDHLNFVA